MENKIIIFTDGATRDNPHGASASGYRIIDIKGNILKEDAKINSIATNNQAEYHAVIMALEWCRDNFKLPQNIIVELYSDSENTVKQINKENKIKSMNLKPLAKKVNDLIKEFREVKVQHRKREDKNISIVDRSLNNLLDDYQSKTL